ncbi:MAG: 2-dehydropantoate 2-reductase [Chloroflexi bacterium]|nr:MAG: 2-dehydropantoate 2-reductase [Chloroflexota bacterium]
MKIAIIGTGAMGCLFAAHLYDAADVVMVGNWPEQLAAIQQNGLSLEGVNGRFTHHPIRATNNPHDAAPVDLAIVLTKSWQTTQTAQLVHKVLAPDGVALTLQNGLGNLEKLTAVLGPTHATLGTTSAGANIVKPGHVRFAGHGVTHIATTNATAHIIKPLVEILNQKGLETHISNEVDSLIWGKLVINAGINPLTALLRVPNGFLAENPITRAIMAAAAKEVEAVAHKLGIQLPYPDAAKRTLAVAQATAPNRSSMLQDVLRGAPTEIEAICGEVVKNGRLANTPTPINQQLLKLVQSISDSPMTIAELQQIMKI